MLLLQKKKKIFHRRNVGGGLVQDARYKCNQLGHIKKIHKSLQEQVEAKVAKDHLEGQQLFAMSYFTSDNWSTKV